MADIKLRISLNPNSDSESLGDITNYNELVATNLNLSNTSISADDNGVFQNIEKASDNGSNGLTWAYGELKFNSEGYLDNIESSNGHLESEQNPTQFFWGVVPEDTKYYYVRLEFANAKNLKDIRILGDKITNQFPIRAILDGSIEVFSDDPDWAIEFPSESETHVIEFTHWNRGNYNATITTISVIEQYLYIDNTNGLKSVESLLESSSSPSEIFYGAIPSSGSAEILDVGGELEDMISDGVIDTSNVEVRLLVNDNEIARHRTEDTDYDNQAKIISFDFGDGLSSWDTLIYGGYNLYGQFQGDNTIYGSRSAYEMLSDVLSKFYPQFIIDTMLSSEIIYGHDNEVGSVKKYLEQIIIPHPYLLSDTYRNTVNKFCKLAQLQLIQSDNGELRFVSARPTATASDLDNCIQLNLRDQFSQLSRTAIVKNRITGAELSENIISVEPKVIASANGFSDSNTANLSLVDIGEDDVPNSGIYGKDNVLVAKMRQSVKKYSISFNLDESNEIFNKRDVSGISLRAKIQKDNSAKTYHAGWFGTSLNSEVSNIDSSSIEEFTPTIFTSPKTWRPATFEFSIVNRKYINQMYGFSAFLDGTEWLDWGVSSQEYSIMADCLNVVDSSARKGSGQLAKIDVASELLQSGTTYKGVKLSTIILNNVINDYSNGIADASITVSCGDYYNENGEKVKDWKSGQIIKVGDIVVPKRDNNGTPLVVGKDGHEYKWRVKSVTFRKTGVPFLDLKLQEIRQL